MILVGDAARSVSGNHIQVSVRHTFAVVTALPTAVLSSIGPFIRFLRERMDRWSEKCITVNKVYTSVRYPMDAVKPN